MHSLGVLPFHEVWASIRRNIGTPLTILGHHKRFVVKDQSTDSLAVATLDGKDAPGRIPREDFERAWEQLKSVGRLAQRDLADQVGARHAAFITSILAETPGIGYRADPITLYVLDHPESEAAHPLQAQATPPPSPPRESGRTSRTRDGGRPSREKPSAHPRRTDPALASAVERWLTASGWRCQMQATPSHGTAIEARDTSGRRWLISVAAKAPAGEAEFLEALESMLRRMDDPAASYSLALPDRPPYRTGWTNIPALVKRRLALTAFFVTDRGEVTYLDV